MSSTPLGAHLDGRGASFAVFSSVATAVELCLFDDAGAEHREALEMDEGYVWRCHLGGVGHGARCGFRVHGPWDPGAGLRCNPAKLLLDPYARAVAGGVTWHPSLAGHDAGDSAPYVPRSVLHGREFDWQGDRPLQRPLEESVMYELHVKGFTK